jgi:ribosomal protein S18 acetylase RimI-like enzyme
MISLMDLRPGHLDDAFAIGERWFDSWMSTKPVNPIVSKADLAQRAGAELAGRWEVTVAEVDHKMVGFLAVVLAEQRLVQLYVSPSAQSYRIGVELLNVAKRRFPGGFWLKAEASNVRVRKFYEREGLTLTGEEIEDGRVRMVYGFEP